MSQLEAFRAEVEGFLARAKMKPTRFGMEAVRDPNFVRDLRKGRAPSMATADRVLSFIRAQKLAPETADAA